MTRLISLLIALWLVSRDTPATDAEGAWLAVGDRGVQLWSAGQRIGLVSQWEKSWAFTPPMRGGSGLIIDYRHDLDRLRAAKPKPVVCPVP